MKKLITAIVISILSVLIIVAPVLAYTYYALINVTESGGTHYTMLPVIATIDNAALETDGYISSTGLDTLVTITGTTKPHMVVDDSVLFASEIADNQSYSVHYEMGDAPIANCHIICGYGGYITTAHDALLEPANNFEVEAQGYFDTSAGATKNIYNKSGALTLGVSGANEITGTWYYSTTTGAKYSSSDDGYNTNSSANYNTARTAASASSTTSTNINITHQLVAATYYISRGYVYFDTSAIPDDAVITAASVYLYGKTDGSGTNFDVVIQNGQPTYPHSPLVVGDYDHTKYSSDGGSYNTSAFALEGWNTIAMNATGLTWISLTGTTKLCLRSSLDIAGTTPDAADEQVIYYSSEEALTTKDPYINVTYTTYKTVVGAAITSGEHTIKLTADETDLKLYDGAVEKDSESIVGLTGIDNGNAIIWNQNNVCPYLDYISYTIHTALTVHYHVADIIAGTVLPDLTGAAQNGAFTWGANPAGVTATSIKLVGQPSGTITNPAATNPDVVAPGTGSLHTTSGISGSPLYPLFESFSDMSGLSEEIWGLIFCFVIAGGLVLMVGRVIKGSVILPVLAGGVGIGIGYALQFYNDLWIPMVYAIVAIAILLQNNRQGQGV
jgi:hypothetical protein